MPSKKLVRQSVNQIFALDSNSADIPYSDLKTDLQRFSDGCDPVGAPAPSQAKPRGCLPLIDKDRRRESAREGAGAPI
jgi:hypothetical protein